MLTPTTILLTTDDAVQLAGLSPRTIRHNCTVGKYSGATKGADGWSIPLSSLPEAAQVRYWAEQQPDPVSDPLADFPIVTSAPVAIDTDALYVAYRQAPLKSKARADNLCSAVIAFEELRTDGESKGRAASHISEKYEVDESTLRRAREAVSGQPRQLWAALLLPKYKGRTKEAEFTVEAWEWIKANYLNTSETAAKVIIKEAKKIGKARAWKFPSDKTITRRLNNIPAPQWLLGRKGNEAFDATFPAAERDFTTYALHGTWVSDGRRADVFCRWPDDTISRPFIVVIIEMRTRMVIGVRIGINPSQNLTLAAFHSALERVNIKPQRVLIDNGMEYAGKRVTGGQNTRYRNKIKDDEPIGALTRMGIKVDWSRPGRGQEKPVEAWWPFTANHVDKTPEFQGAYCGKDTVSKPEDFDRSKAISIEIYAAKLAEIIEEFNTSHMHRGQGMSGKMPAQLYEELMQAEPHKEWPRPTAEDKHLMCLDQKILTLNNKDASIRFKFEGYGEMRYWSEKLADLPPSARTKKYNVYFNPEDPDIPVLVYNGMRMICEAQRIGMVGSKVAATQHCINKADFKKPRIAAFKAIKQAVPLGLPTPAASLSIQSVVIEKPSTPAIQPELPKLKELSPGLFYDPATGQTVGKGKPPQPNNLSESEVEKYQRIREEREAERMKRFGTE